MTVDRWPRLPTSQDGRLRGYGSALEKLEWDEGLPGYAPSSQYNEMARSFFFKVSYLYRF